MGERHTGQYERYSVRDAADILGITTGAVRSRLSRGTLQSERIKGTVYVLLPRNADEMPTDTLADELRDRLRYVESQLEAERQAHAEARRIIAGLVERLPPQIEAGAPPEPRESPVRATEQPGRVEPQAPIEERQEPAEPRRSWWGRIFGY